MAVEPRIKVEDEAIKAALQRLGRALPLGGDMTPAMQSLGRIGKTGAQLRFRSETAPDGTRWLRSKRAKAEGGQTLSLTRRLRNSITYAADHASVEIGTNVIYARIHQLGGVAGRVYETGGVFLPARAYLGFSDADTEEAIRTLNDHYRRVFYGT